MPLTAGAVSFLNSTNLSTDTESVANYGTWGAYFAETKFGYHVFPGGKVVTMGTQTFANGTLPGTDGSTDGSAGSFGITMLRVDADGTAHIVASLHLVGSRRAHQTKVRLFRISDTVMEVAFSSLVALTTTASGNHTVGCGRVRIDSAANTITSLGRQTVPSTDLYWGTTQQNYWHAVNINGVALFVADRDDPNLKVGYKDPVSGAGGYVNRHIITNAGGSGSYPNHNWNQAGYNAIWTANTGADYLQASSYRGALTAPNQYYVHKAAIGLASWPSTITAGPVTSQQSTDAVGASWEGVARNNLFQGSAPQIFGYTYGPTDASNQLVSTLVDPYTAGSPAWDPAIQGSEVTASLGLIITYASGFLSPQFREYLANGVEHGAWSVGGGLDIRIMPANAARTRFFRFNGVTLTVYSYPTANPLPVVLDTWHVGGIGASW